MTESERRRIIPFAMRAALASVGMAVFLLLLKGFAAWHTGSVAMLGSLADTALDLLASLVTLYGVKLAAEPADHDHRFGHGKAEALAALFQVVLITASAIGIAWRAIERFGNPRVNEDAGLGIGVSAWFQGYAGAAGADALAETGQGFGNYLMTLGVIETVALFVLVFIRSSFMA